MKRFLILFAALAAFFSPAQAEPLIADNGESRVLLLDSPCTPSVLVHILPEKQDLLKQAFATVSGVSHNACWAIIEGGVVYVKLDDGRFTLIDLVAFKAEPGA